ncbi:unnamed protein product [Rhizoctonia solani]|uniref:Uncharacterized protein n=1 Tax=Rhizoctonia solani TaxID=456999 RepID=A0A8H3H9I3_9AGAM|nr:unnamed protein product [Rhizoctonia solani]
MSIHDHLFCLCIDSLSSGNNTESASAHTHSETAAEHEVTDGWVTPTLDGNEISLGRIFELLSRLHEFQLLSLAQLCEYIFRVIEWYKTATGPAATEAVTGIRSLLSSCCPNPRCSPWENEIVSFCKWVDTRSRLDEYQDNANAGGADEAKMQHVVANPEDIMINHSGPSIATSSNLISSLGTRPSDDGHGSACRNKLNGLTEVHDCQEGEMDETAGNNIGKPPQTPGASRPESPADAFLEEKQVLMTLPKGMEHRTMSSINPGSVRGTQAFEIFRDTKAVAAPAATPKITPCQPPANGIKLATPTLTQRILVNEVMATALNVASTASAVAATPPGKIPTPSKQETADGASHVHVLSQGLSPKPQPLPPSTLRSSQTGLPGSPLQASVASSIPPPSAPASSDTNAPVSVPAPGDLLADRDGLTSEVPLSAQITLAELRSEEQLNKELEEAREAEGPEEIEEAEKMTEKATKKKAKKERQAREKAREKAIKKQAEKEKEEEEEKERLKKQELIKIWRDMQLGSTP